MSWPAEVWTWTVASAKQLLVMFWWATAGVFLMSAAARWWVLRRVGEDGTEGEAPSRTWPVLLGRAITASGRGDWKRRAVRWLDAGGGARFAVFVAAAHLLPVYVLLIPVLYGKEYLPVYLGAAVLDLALIGIGARWLDLSRADGGGAARESDRSEAGGPAAALLDELGGVVPRLAYGFLAAGVLAALAIRPAWAFPVEVTGGGLVPQLLNGLGGAALAVGAWMPPVAALVVGLAVWRSGFALTGLLAFLLALPAAPQSVAAYGDWLGRREAAKLAVLYAAAAVLAGLAASWAAGAVGWELPYVYDAAQVW